MCFGVILSNTSDTVRMVNNVEPHNMGEKWLIENVFLNNDSRVLLSND